MNPPLYENILASTLGLHYNIIWLAMVYNIWPHLLIMFACVRHSLCICILLCIRNRHQTESNWLTHKKKNCLLRSVGPVVKLHYNTRGYNIVVWG